jgi:Coenzyme PQQ synthesis protein D (PqqD)
MTMMLDLTAHYARHPEAMESRLGDETVILHLESGLYFGLDWVGTIVWERLLQGDTPEAICTHVRTTFIEPPESVEADVLNFLVQLLEHALIERS